LSDELFYESLYQFLSDALPKSVLSEKNQAKDASRSFAFRQIFEGVEFAWSKLAFQAERSAWKKVG